jgi:thiamine-monophosphate kinase
LLYPHKYEHLNREIKDKVIFAHQYPKPRLDIIKPLQEATSHFNKEELIIAGMDSSDGLADALIQICQQSQVGAKIDLTQLSIPPEILAMVDEETAWNWLLYGGEDFELVLSVSPSLGDYLLKQFPSQYKCLGEITENNNIEINSHPKFLLNQKKTFQHF